MSSPYRITGKETVPRSTVLNGTVTTNTNRSDVLDYSGTSDLDSIFSQAKTGLAGCMYIFIPANDLLIQVLYVTKDPATPNTYTIFLASAAAGVSGATAYSVEANLISYSYINDGGGNGTVNGVTVEDGTGFESQPSGRSISGDTLWKKPVYINGTGTSFLVYESK